MIFSFHRALNSHDVAAPVTPQVQTTNNFLFFDLNTFVFSTTINNQGLILKKNTRCKKCRATSTTTSRWRPRTCGGWTSSTERPLARCPPRTLNITIITNITLHQHDNQADHQAQVWHTINSQVRLVHVNTSAALRFTGKNYPEWGFMQLEVASDRNIQQADTVWNVEEHRYTQNDKDKSTIEKEMMTHELIPEGQTQLTFWEKFWELQVKMLITNQENVQNHNFASDPTEWPFLTRGIAYYIAKESNNQVHLMGNIVVWYTGSICLLLYSSLLVFYLLRRRRLIYDIPEAEFASFCNAGEVLLTGFLVHYLPFYFYDRTLFVHHYLPAYIFKIMLSAFFLSHCASLLSRVLSAKVVKLVCTSVTIVWLAAVVFVFHKFSVLSYAHTALSADDVRDLRWKDTWDLIIHKK